MTMGAIVQLRPDVEPPMSIEAEQSTLGAMMLDPNCVATVSEIVTDADFFAPVNQMLFRVIQFLSAKGAACDAVTVTEVVQRNQTRVNLTVAPEYVISLAGGVASSKNAAAYAGIVRQKSLARRTAAVCADAAAEVRERGADAGAILASTIARLMDLQRADVNHEHTLRQAMSAAYDEVSAAMRGELRALPTGIKQLDEQLGGWHNGDLIVIAARPSHGKTALLLNHALAAQNARIGIISAEQPAAQIAARALSITGRVNAGKMRAGSIDPEVDLPKLIRATETLLQRSAMIYDRSNPSIGDVERVARKWSAQDGLDLLVVDYIQRIRSDGERKQANRAELIGDVVRGLKNLARDLNIPVIAAAQVGRQVDARADHQPGMGDISDSSEVEKEADQIITLMRPVVYEQSADPTEARLCVVKNRHGPIGMVEANFEAKFMAFGDRGLDY